MAKRDENFYSVFDAPTQHTDNLKKPSAFKKTVAIVSGVLAASIIIGAAFWVVNVMPESKKKDSGNALEPFTVLEVAVDDFKAITVTDNGGNKIELYSENENIEIKNEDGSTSTDIQKNWYIKGYDKANVSTSINSLLTSAATIKAYREITEKTAKECGFENPQYRVEVKREKGDDFSFLLGDNSPDGIGIYLMFEDKIYLIDEQIISKLTIDAKSIVESASSEL